MFSKLTRRDIASVNVDQSCDDILQYIEVRLDPQLPRKHRPRLSLYLSSLLMYGIVRIHNKHSQYLLDDVVLALTKFGHIINKLTEIELRELPRADLVTLPDMAMDFENMSSQELDNFLIVPEHHEDVWWLEASLLSPKSEVMLSPEPARKRKTRKGKTGEEEGERTGPQVANVEDITLREAPTLPCMDMDNIMSPHRQIPPDQDLPPMTQAELEDLLLQGEEPIPPREEQMGPLPDLPTSTPAHPGMQPPTQQHGQSILSPIVPLREELEVTLPVQPEVRPRPSRKPSQPPAPEVTMTTSPQQGPRVPRHSLEMDLSEIRPGVSPSPRRRRRQLVFADKETQISKEKMKEFLNTGATTCEPFTVKDTTGMEAHDLLMMPGDRALHRPPWLSLWQRRARFRRGLPESELAGAVTPPRDLYLIQEEPMFVAFPIPGMTPPRDVDLFQEEPMFVAYPLPQEMSLEMPRTMVETPSLGQETSVRQVSFADQHTPAIKGKRKGRKRPSSALEQSIEDLRQTAAQSESGVRIADISMGEEAAKEKSRGDDSINDSTGTRSSKKHKTRSSSTNASMEVLQDSSTTTAPTASFHTSGSSRALFDIVEETRFPDFFAVPIREDLEEQMNDQSLLDTISECITAGEEDFTLFSTVCPPETSDRKSAARIFMVLLGLCTQRLVTVRQEKDVDFGEMIIRTVD
ncbi:meiotic recombination protein REC8 homolog isoform X2 [Dreissena polymorpha]|nr:meiotic recombination protein REC8 homolog isoform X2 [Dreissena polymorpha]